MSLNTEYHCTHCGHRFKDEDKDVVECPKCFWSSSVERASAKSKPIVSEKKENLKEKHSGKQRSFLFIVFLFFMMALGAYLYIQISSEKKSSMIKLSQKASLNISAEPLVAKEEDAKVVVNQVEAPAVKDEDLLFLTKTLSFEDVSAMIKTPKDLGEAVTFKVGLVEKLPSQPWQYEQFEEMIKKQEAFYKVPLTRKYKKELDEHFEAHYKQGRLAFEAGQLLKTRDEFVKTLAFPIYANDPKRHRVALTMLKPFINDTLSKIGALNTMLVDDQLRGQEANIQNEYRNLLELIERKSWSDSLLKIKNVQSLISTLQNRNLNEMQAPSYPSQLVGLDPGIAGSLADLQKPSQTLLSDLNPLSRDLVKKYQAIERLTEKAIRTQLDHYNQASSDFGNKKWNEGFKKLNKITKEDVLFEKASQKKEKLYNLGVVKKA